MPTKGERDAQRGQRLGPYRLGARLGQGGMGAVYRAVHEPTGAPCAVKVLLRAEPEDLLRFRREAEALARLDHPHVVRVKAADFTGATPYLVQDLLPGGSLADRLARGPLPPEEAALLVAKLADGLQHAHDQGVLHRDLKPENVLFDELGEPRLADFGLALDAADRQRLTQTGELLGTPAYMAPEQVEAGQDVDVRTDVYGLGAVLYAVLTARPPVVARGSVLEALRAVLEEEPPLPSALRPGLPAHLDVACRRALAKRPDERFASARALGAALRRQPARPRLPLGAVACAVLGALGLGVVLAEAGGRHPDPPGALAPGGAPPGPSPSTPAPVDDAAAAGRRLAAGDAAAALRLAIAGGRPSPAASEVASRALAALWQPAWLRPRLATDPARGAEAAREEALSAAADALAALEGAPELRTQGLLAAGRDEEALAALVEPTRSRVQDLLLRLGALELQVEEAHDLAAQFFLGDADAPPEQQRSRVFLAALDETLAEAERLAGHARARAAARPLLWRVQARLGQAFLIVGSLWSRQVPEAPDLADRGLALDPQGPAARLLAVGAAWNRRWHGPDLPEVTPGFPPLFEVHLRRLWVDRLVAAHPAQAVEHGEALLALQADVDLRLAAEFRVNSLIRIGDAYLHMAYLESPPGGPLDPGSLERALALTERGATSQWESARRTQSYAIALLAAGRFDEAEQQIRAITSEVGRTVLEAELALAVGEAEGAVAALEPFRAGGVPSVQVLTCLAHARFLAGRADWEEPLRAVDPDRVDWSLALPWRWRADAAEAAIRGEGWWPGVHRR